MRCDHITTRGQCKNEAIAPTRFCDKHSERSQATMINQYRIACRLLAPTAQRHNEGNTLKSLRGEIVILRSMLERRLNLIESDAELMAAMPAIKDAALAIDKLATSCHNMDVKLGNLLDKQALMTLAQRIIVIIEEGIRPFAEQTVSNRQIDETVEAIANSIAAAIAKQENKTKTKTR